MNKDNKKKLISRVMKELEMTLHRAIDAGKEGNLNVFEMIMVSADTLDKAYRVKKQTKINNNNVVAFKRKEQ